MILARRPVVIPRSDANADASLDSVWPPMTAAPDSPFLAAAHGRAARHTPVWFMRQAGRSLPEYRARRGEGSILDAIKQPELAAEITLQPVRRYGVDAAVLYSDIVVPAHAIGFGIDVAPGTGPVAEHRSGRERPRPAPPARAGDRHAVRDRDGPAARRRARRPAARVRRRAVHRRQLPDRGPALAHLRAHQGADARRRGAVARADGPPRRRCRSPRSAASSTPAPRRSSCSTPGPARSRRADYERFVLPALAAGLRGSGREPSGRRRRSTSASAATTCSSRCTPPDPR